MSARVRHLLIFDCDGTLVDSELLCNVALEACLRDAGVVEPAASLLARYRGAKLAGALADIAARHGRDLPSSFVDGYRDAVAALFERELRATEGMAEALERLAQRGFAMCVASSGPVAKITQALALTGLARFFGDRIYSAYAVRSWKPDPGLFLHAANHQGMRPADCIVIEDSEVGVEAARRAGMPFLLYDPHGLARDEAIAGGARFPAMAALPDLVGA